MASIGGAINAEWERLVQSDAAQIALRRWAQAWPALAGCGGLRDVLELRRDPARAQAVLRPLALMSPSDEMAARTLLQALMPGLVSLARSVASDDSNALDEILALAWERIRTYPGHREGSVAGNVLLDVRKRYARQRGFGSTAVELVPGSDPAVSVSENDFDSDLIVDLLQAAIAGGLLSQEEVDMIVRSRMFEVPLREIAVERGISARALGQQRWRAEERLRRMPEADQVRSWSAA